MSCSGTRGPQGPQGPHGAQGEAGPQGVQGSQGFQGVQGPQGITGAQGTQGSQGNAGSVGPAGPPGPQGTQGVQGAAGVQGPQGNNGSQGPQGSQGAQGAQGASTGGSGSLFFGAPAVLPNGVQFFMGLSGNALNVPSAALLVSQPQTVTSLVARSSQPLNTGVNAQQLTIQAWRAVGFTNAYAPIGLPVIIPPGATGGTITFPGVLLSPQDSVIIGLLNTGLLYSNSISATLS